MAKNKKKSRKKLTVIIIIVVVVLALAAAAYFFILPKKGSKNAAASVTYTEEKTSRHNISRELTGSGTLQPADSYTVTTLVEGEILTAEFEEGDIVEKDTVLYTIDPADASNNIDRAEISLTQAKRNYQNNIDKQYVRSDIAGTVTELSVSVGDEVRQGQTVGYVKNTSVLVLKLPFTSVDAAGISVGSAASVVLDGSFETLSGTVTAVSSAETVGTGNIKTRNVTIEVKNNGGLSDGLAATAEVGSAGSVSSGKLSYKAEATLTAPMAATVGTISKPEGSAVAKDDIVIKLTGKDVSDMLKQAEESLRNSEMSADNTIKQLDNYTVKSPISGTIIEKYYKKGDNTSTNRTLCIIYDLTYLEMTLSIDELDISTVAVGQKVEVTADAVDGKTYEGVITKVSVAGTTSNNTTVYPVTIRIDEIDGLLPGMNADAKIVIDSAENVIAVPNSAVTRGNVVLVTKDSPSAANAVEREAPEGYVYVRVVTGLSDDDFTEISSGLTDDDTIAYIKRTIRGRSVTNMMGQGGFSFSGGSAPGGAPGGGTNRNYGGNSGNRSYGGTR
ncbi:MAG: HlyD family efflux transporter periplasmic adaptor subunit [Clostridia bacterium]|nr:HlyD family efflux transporter periplasmic adaptor subunit [Clostridia bacterium]